MDAITILVNNDKQTVSGRDLHEALQIKTRYSDWFKKMCEYGFAPPPVK